MSNITFKLENGIGVGYKAIPNSYIKKTNTFIVYENEFNWSKQWRNSGYKKDIICEYPLGFHIFRNQIDARRYGLYMFGTANSFTLVKVEYKNVLAFGKNSISLYHEYGDCIIADKMRIVECLS